jgi:hypothetical protein
MKKEQNLHLGINFNEAIESKKQILYNKMHLIEILKRLEAYKDLRKKELIQKEKLGNELKKIITKINSILKELPKIKTDAKLKLKKDSESQKISKDTKSKRKIETELKDIKKQIQELEGKY